MEDKSIVFSLTPETCLQGTSLITSQLKNGT
jgi:hypothetical protein